MKKRIKKLIKKYKKEDKSSILIALLFFYFVLSIIMIMGCGISLMNIINKKVIIMKLEEVLTNKLAISCYMINMMMIGSLMLVGSVAGSVGVYKKNISLILFSIIMLIISSIIFVSLDEYYSVTYNVMSYFNYFINILALSASSWLLIKGYKEQKELI